MDLIVAVDANWGIGFQGTQPAVLPEDRRRFRELTTGATVVAGRKTLLDFPGGRPLPNRENIILSARRDFTVEGALVVHDRAALLQAVAGRDPRRVFVIGGERVYREFLSCCELAYVTKIFETFEADRFFPDLDADDRWSLLEEGPVMESGGLSYQFSVYQNNECVSERE